MRLLHYNKKPINIKTPLRLDESGFGYFEPNTTTIDAVVDNLINCFSTKIGERVMRPNFGSNLYSYIFEQSVADLKSKVNNEVRRVIATYFNGIQLIGVNVLTIEEDASAPQNGYRVIIKIKIPELGDDEAKTLSLDINGQQKL